MEQLSQQRRLSAAVPEKIMERTALNATIPTSFCLIGTIERPAAVERDQFRQRMILIRETGEGPQ